MRFTTKKAVCSVLLLLCGAAQAHSPRFSCQVESAQQIFCEGGFSDGSSAQGVGISVRSYEDRLLWSGTLDARGQIRFQRPEGSFYIRFEGGAGHLVEVDSHEIP